LKFFNAVAHQPGVATELDATFAELQRCDQTPAQIAQNLDALNPALADKLHDLALLHAEYANFLGQDRLDPQRRLDEALASIQRCASLRAADVYVDGFYDFTQHQRRVLAGLGKVCPSVNITLCIDPKSECIENPHRNPEELDLFHKTEEAYRRLWFTFSEEGVKLEKPVILDSPRRFADPQLAALEQWSGDSIAAPGNGIRMIVAPDRRAEVDAAARWVVDLIASGHRYRDIAVLMRGEEEYRDLIDASFREHGIPFFVDRRRTAAHHPMLRLIRAAIAVARQNFAHDAMMALLKTGLVGLSAVEADNLENYVLLHGIAHETWIKPDSWTGNRRVKIEEDADSPPAPSQAENIDNLRRRVVQRLNPFVQSVKSAPRLPVRDFATAVFKLLEAFEVRTQIVMWMKAAEEASHLEERGEHERVWAELVKLVDELVDLFGDERISLNDFQAILDSALESFDLALAPPTVDQVLVGAVDRMRTPPLKACVVLGLAEGQFPRAGKEDTVFSSADRRALAARKIDLDPDTQRRLLDETFWAYIAVTRASHHLLLTRSIAAGDGRAVAPSPYWRTIAERFPGIEPQAAPREDDLSPAGIATPRQLVSALMCWVRAGGKTDDTWAAVYQWLADDSSRRPAKSPAIDTVRYRAWKALSHQNNAILSRKNSADLFTSPLNVSIRQLESFAACPFQHFLRHGLGLAQRQEREVRAVDLSQVYHDVLDHLVRNLISSGKSWVDLEEPQVRQILSDLTKNLGKQLRDELMVSTARNRYLLDHIERTLRSVAAAQKAAAARGQFRAAFTNVRFGGAPSARPNPSRPDPLPALMVQSARGTSVEIRGKIDRIDLLPDGSACVVDYRLRIDSLNAARAFHGLSLQLLTYLLFLEKNGKHLLPTGKLATMAGFCVELLRQVRKQSPEGALSPDDPLFHLLVKPRGVFDHRCASKFDAELSDGESEVVAMFVKKDGELGKRNTGDAVLPEEFAALLAHAEKRIGELSDRIVSGEISIRPSRLGRVAPCPQCEFRDVCRFEPAPGAYVELEPMKREQMLQRVMEEHSG
jgi:ATP-dependent helicase/nuclease subunit B